MEILGIGANMEGSSNYTNFYFTRDFKEILSGCTWPQVKEDKIKNGHSSKAFLSPLSAGLYIGYSREALKQIMLKQEAIFKDQIYELHRLYQRQREFNAEMKRRESQRHGLCTGTSQSDFHKSQVFKLHHTQDAQDCPVYGQSFVSGKEKTLPSTQGNTIRTGPNSFLNGISANDPYSLESKSKILGKEKFELPIDNVHFLEEKDALSLVEKLSEVPDMSSNHLKRVPETAHFSDVNPFLASYDLNASLYSDLSTTDSLLGKTKVLIDLNDPLNFEEVPGSGSDDLMDVTGLEGSICKGSEFESVTAESHPSFTASANCLDGQIDLNVCINDEFPPKPCCSTEIDLEVPPQREIHSSPRGEFNENQVVPHSLKSSQDDAKPMEDPIDIAAEALVSISSSVAPNCPETTSSKLAQASYETLLWFAGIVSSTGGDPEKVEIDVTSKDDGDSEELFPNCMDDYEIMTLKLTETKVEGCSLVISDQEKVKSVSLSSCQLGNGRMRRSQRNNFQTEVLPSLVTLSRYEVTGDIQTIGGLMEATCSQPITGVVKNASKSRTVWTRGKRRSSNSTSKNTKSTMRSTMDQLKSGIELGIEEMNTMVWGNITQRPRGQRYPASKRKIILGQA